MKKESFKRIWFAIGILVVITTIALAMWYVPYEISHDQHMVDTVNERALEYEHPEGVITDFTESEIMMLDAQEGYENKVWKLDHQELYWYGGIIKAIVFSILLFIVVFMGYKLSWDYMECNSGFYDSLDEDIDFSDKFEVELMVDEMSSKQREELLILADEIQKQEEDKNKSTFPEEVVEP